MIDASIPLQTRGVDLQQIMMNAERLRAGRERQQDNQRRVTLGELYNQDHQGAIEEAISAGDLELAKQFQALDETQRKHAEAGIADLSAAVRWADTPDKWSQVQQYYHGKGVDLTPYDFSHRENGMLMLGKIGDYMKSEDKNNLVVIDGVAIDRRTGEPQFESPYDIIKPGPNGSFYRQRRFGFGRGGQAPTNQPRPLTDEDIARMEGGQTQPASGGFPQRPF